MNPVDEEESRENLSHASLESIVEKAQSPDHATQLAAVQVNKILNFPMFFLDIS